MMYYFSLQESFETTLFCFIKIILLNIVQKPARFYVLKKICLKIFKPVVE